MASLSSFCPMVCNYEDFSPLLDAWSVSFVFARSNQAHSHRDHDSVHWGPVSLYASFFRLVLLRGSVWLFSISWLFSIDHPSEFSFVEHLLFSLIASFKRAMIVCFP